MYCLGAKLICMGGMRWYRMLWGGGAVVYAVLWGGGARVPLWTTVVEPPPSPLLPTTFDSLREGGLLTQKKLWFPFGN